jgi:hypothetical protein
MVVHQGTEIDSVPIRDGMTGRNAECTLSLKQTDTGHDKVMEHMKRFRRQTRIDENNR